MKYGIAWTKAESEWLVNVWVREGKNNIQIGNRVTIGYYRVTIGNYSNR